MVLTFEAWWEINKPESSDEVDEFIYNKLKTIAKLGWDAANAQYKPVGTVKKVPILPKGSISLTAEIKDGERLYALR